MAKRKIQLSDVLKKHLRVALYLAISAVLAYALSVLADRPEVVYFAPIINYVIYAVKQELDREGVVSVLRK